MLPTRPEQAPHRRRIPFLRGGVRLLLVETLIVLAVLSLGLVLAAVAVLFLG